jgi:uncharacterized membrane protein
MAEHTTPIHTPQQTPRAVENTTGNARVNVGNSERLLSLVGGGALVFYGLRRSLGSLALMLGGGALIYRGITGYCAAYKAIGISTANADTDPGVLLESTVTVNKPVADVYRFWRQVENHPRFMTHLEAAVSTSEKRSHWMARGPLHIPLAWDADLIEERPNTLLVWRSVPGADIDAMGTVRLRELPDGRGTEVRLRLEYVPPGGMAGIALAKLLKTLTVGQLKEDLRRFKQIIEAGETPTVAPPVATTSPRQESHRGSYQPVAGR